MISIRTTVVMMLMLAATTGAAQTKREVLKARIDSALQAKYNKVNYDTVFISRPNARVTLKLRGNVSGNLLKTKGKYKGMDTRSKLTTDTKATLSIGVNYQGLAAGIAINPSKLKGRNNDYELNVNAYSNRYSIDATYQMSKTLSGDIRMGDNSYHVDKGFLKTRMFYLTGNYTFNYKRFSYPAAFSQTYIQKRSAGSWLAGFSLEGGSMNTTDEVPEGTPELRFGVGNFAIGGGYGYNLVVKDKWLFHLSAMPMLVVFKTDKVTLDGERQKMPTNFPEMILNERMAIVYNISPKYFLGLTGVANNTLFESRSRSIRQSKWQTKLFLGIRL